MSAYYKIHVLTVSGILLAEVDNFRELAYTNMVNSPGIAEIVMNGTANNTQYMVIDNQIEIYRINRRFGINDWQRDFVGFIRKEQRSTKRGEDTMIITALGLNELLGRRVNGYYANTGNRSIYTDLPVETVMKTFVQYNCGSDAVTLPTISGRVRNGELPNFTVETDQARGVIISWANAWKPVLRDLQDLADTYTVDFQVSKVGPANWSFEVYPFQLGTDRTSEITFALENNNMTDPEYVYDATEQKTIAIAAGEGEEAERQIVIQSGIGFGIDNDREVFTDARGNQDNPDVLSSAAASNLKQNEAREEFKFQVLQTFSSYYGKHYFLGDRVKSQYKGRGFIQKIVGVTVQYDRTNLETITVDMKTV